MNLGNSRLSWELSLDLSIHSVFGSDACVCHESSIGHISRFISSMSSIPELLATSYRQYYQTQCAHLSSLTFLVWDYIVTLPDEVELFWTGKWSYLRLLFFVNRYQVICWQTLHTIGIFMITKPGFEQLYVDGVNGSILVD
ncbi:hypothetical protein AB1N83_003535 [Pleurotus pulmonarius]